MPPILNDVFGYIGLLRRALGFLVFGFALGRFLFDNFITAVWRVEIARVLGVFGLLIVLTDFATAGSSGAFALSAGAAYVVNLRPLKPGVPADEQ